MQPFTVQPQLPSASKTPYKYVQTNNHSLQNREQEPIRRWNDRSRNRPRYLSSPAAATLHGKTRGFVLRLPPQHKPHATCMQPAQVITMHVSQPKIPKHHMYVTAMRRNMRNTSKQLLHCGLLLGLAEPSPHPPHTRSTFNRRLQPIYTEKHSVLRSSFPPNPTSPMQQSCSHYNAFCSNTYTSMRPLHYDFHPLVAASIVKSQTTICDKKFRTTLHECIVMWCKVSHHPSWMSCVCDVKSHTTLHECIVMWCKVSQPHTTLHDVLLCDVKSHTTLHECIVMWCKVSPPFMMSCYVM